MGGPFIDTHHTRDLQTSPSAFKMFAESPAPVENCLNRESAAALLALPANPRLQTRVDELAEQCHEGQFTPAECSENEALIWADHFPGLVQVKARHCLRTHAVTWWMPWCATRCSSARRPNEVRRNLRQRLVPLLSFPSFAPHGGEGSCAGRARR